MTPAENELACKAAKTSGDVRIAVFAWTMLLKLAKVLLDNRGREYNRWIRKQPLSSDLPADPPMRKSRISHVGAGTQSRRGAENLAGVSRPTVYKYIQLIEKRK